MVDVAVEKGIIQKSGSWFSYNDEKIGQGRERVLEYLRNNADVAEEINAKVREKLGF